MVANFLAGGAVVNAFAAQVGAEVVVVDVGVATPLGPRRRAARPQGPPRHRRPGRRPGDDPRRGAPRRRGRHRGGHRRSPPTAPLPGHRRHGHREHHRVGRADLRLHRRRRPPTPPAGAPASTTPRWPARSTSSSRARRRVPAPAGRPPRRPLAALAEVGGLEHAALAGFVLGAAAAPGAGDAGRRHRRLGGAGRRGAVPDAPSSTCSPGTARSSRAPRSRCDAPGAAPAARPGPAARRGHRRAAGPAARGRRRPGAARRGHLRLRGRDREGALLPTRAGQPSTRSGCGCGRRVVVVGGGQVAHRRVAGLLEARRRW